VTARRRIASAALLALLIAALLLAVPSLRGVLDQVGDMQPGWVLAAVALEVASCLAFVAVFRLFFESVEPTTARRVAWTEMASGALLPGGGVTALAAGGWLIRLTGMPADRIVRRSSALFFLTSAVNVIALAAGGFLLALGLGAAPADAVLTGVPIALGLGAIAAALAVPRLMGERRRGRRVWLEELAEGIRDAQRTIRRPSWRLAAAVGYLGFDIAVLWATLRALGYAPAVAALVVAYLIGYLATWVPIPGGVGVLDGGLAGALILYGIKPVPAAAAVLVYHAIALWIPGLGGAAAYTLLRRQLLSNHGRRALHPSRLDPAHRVAPAHRGLRGMPQDRIRVGAPAHVRDVREDRVLRQLPEPAREQARTRRQPPDLPLSRAG
jgi:uncharacterized membrane protein YbhN (UPF0104 family)